jgi:hypothetical protein
VIGELVIGVAEKDEAEHRDRVLRRFQFRIGAEFVGGSPKAFFEFAGVGWHVVVTGQKRVSAQLSLLRFCA